MGTVVDSAPRCREPVHHDRWTNCDRRDQRTLAIELWNEGPPPSAATFVFARAVGSLWRGTPQSGQRVSCAWLSL
jgi:hypothetical protein